MVKANRIPGPMWVIRAFQPITEMEDSIYPATENNIQEMQKGIDS